MSFTSDVKGLLKTASVGTEGGAGSAWPIFIGSEPDGDDATHNCITLYDMPGLSPNPKWLLDYPRMLARVRALDYPTGFDKAEELKSALLGLPSQDINGIRYVGIWVVIDTYFLKADEQGRSIFVSTWRAITEPPSGTHRQPL
jgi:hypothetical protein